MWIKQSFVLTELVWTIKAESINVSVMRMSLAMNSTVSWRQRHKFLPCRESTFTVILIAYSLRLHSIGWVCYVKLERKMAYWLAPPRGNLPEDCAFGLFICVALNCERLLGVIKNRLVRCLLVQFVVLWTYFCTFMNFTKY